MLQLAAKKLRGKIVMETGEKVPGWLPVGGVKPLRLSGDQAAELVRTFPPKATLPAATALIYTTSGDIVPGELKSFDSAGLEFASSVTEVKRFPATSIQALQLGGTRPSGLSGFNSPEWRLLKGSEKDTDRTENSLTLEPGATIGNASALESNEISFSFSERNSFATLRLRLFSNGTDASPSTALLLANFGDSFYAGLETAEGQMNQRAEIPIFRGKPTAVRLVFSEKDVELFVNGAPTEKFPIDPAKRAGAGLILEVGSLWGNTPRKVQIENFASAASFGARTLADVPAETRRQALTVPRFRRENLPRHMLLAMNGDLLRGEIQALTSTHFAFRAGLEELRIPRDRVKAAIWLKKPEPGAPKPAAAESPLQKTLQRKLREQIHYTDANLTTLLSVIRQQAPQLKITAPKDPDFNSEMPFGDQSIGQALEQIAGLFNLRMRVVEPDTVILEQGVSTNADLVTRAYWLKEAAFPAEGSPKEILAAKGAAFAKEASASWDPAGRQLIVINAPGNFLALEEVLTRDFGGSLGSPTHWFQLTSGARLGMAVERFAADAVTGSHSLYGRCEIP
ncbi:MAG TPA: hypothetical protein VF593_02525, partial [Chthoniobacteraceae bacterium]